MWVARGRFVCQNLCCLIHAIYEFGLTPSFWGRDADADRAILKFPDRLTVNRRGC